MNTCRQQARKKLKEVGWWKGLELANWPGGTGSASMVQPGCTGRELPKEQFEQEIEKELTRRETEPREIIYFKLYQASLFGHRTGNRDRVPNAGKRQITTLPLGNVCADFLAGAKLENGDPEMLIQSITRFFKFLPGEQKQAFLENLGEKAS